MGTEHEAWTFNRIRELVAPGKAEGAVEARVEQLLIADTAIARIRELLGEAAKKAGAAAPISTAAIISDIQHLIATHEQSLAGVYIERLIAADAPSGPVPMIMHCPACSRRHIDVGEFAVKVHHTHACQECGTCWRPAVVATVGVQFLPGFKNEPDADQRADVEVARPPRRKGRWEVEPLLAPRGALAVQTTFAPREVKDIPHACVRCGAGPLQGESEYCSSCDEDNNDPTTPDAA